MIVLRRNRTGWTLNFARPLALPALAAMVLVLLAPFYAMGMLGTDLHGHDWAFFFALIAALSFFCSRAADPYRHARKPPVKKR